jgi:hypothetical protein
MHANTFLGTNYQKTHAETQTSKKEEEEEARERQVHTGGSEAKFAV